MILQEAISTYLAYCIDQKILSPKTTKAYQIDLQQFAEFTQNKYDREHIKTYITQLHKQFKPKTAKRKIAALKAFTHYLMVQDIIDINPFDKIDTSFREPIMLPKTIPFNIISAILSSAHHSLNLCKTDYSRKCVLRDIAEGLFDML